MRASALAFLVACVHAVPPPAPAPEPPPPLSEVASAPERPSLPADPAVTALALGAAHSCALVNDGRLVCWGSNGHGQLGEDVSYDDDRAWRSPAPVRDRADFTAISVAGDTTCGLARDGSVSCWGEGIPSTSIHHAPVPTLAKHATAVSVSRRFVCARHEDASVECHVLPWIEGAFVWHPDVGHVEQLAVNDSAVCVVDGEGAMRCWDPATRREWAGPKGVRRLVSGGDRTCALLADGMLRCLRFGPVEEAVQFDVGALRDLAVGRAGGCVVDEDGRVSCWQWGSGFEDVQVPESTRVSVGEKHACAVLAEGGVMCWGANGSRQVGVDSRMPGPAPVAGVSEATAVAMAEARTCVRRRSGEVACAEADGAWKVLPLKGVQQIAMASTNACALLEGGKVACWGEVQAWNARTEWTESWGPGPRVIDGISGAIAMTVTPARVCVTRAKGGPVCAVPGRLLAPEDVTELPVDETNVTTCEVQPDGSVACTGANFEGQLGDGTSVRRDGFAIVRGLPRCVSAAAGRERGCAVADNGELWCWGGGREGQVEVRPVRVSGVP